MTSCLLLTMLASLTATELLDRSIAHHDPNGTWARGAFVITETAARPDGTSWQNVLRFDNARGRFELETTADGHALALAVEGDRVEARLDGRSDLTEEERERYRLKPAQILSRRDMSLYLWGLPMKLKDPGTRLDPVVMESTFQGRSVNRIRVSYDAAVGRDIWYFYFDPATCALVGHRFHHDEAAGDGEYTVLEGEVAGAELRLPRVRRWFMNQGDAPVITHTVESIAAP